MSQDNDICAGIAIGLIVIAFALFWASTLGGGK